MNAETVKKIEKRIILVAALVFFIFTAGDWIYVNRYNLKNKRAWAYMFGWKTYPEASNYPFYSVSELSKNCFSGKYNTQGYVVHEYMAGNSRWTPWRLPWFLRCGWSWDYVSGKLVGTPGIVISESKKSFNRLSPDDMLRIDAHNFRQFKRGKKYTFSVELSECTYHDAYYGGKENQLIKYQPIQLLGYSEQK